MFVSYFRFLLVTKQCNLAVFQNAFIMFGFLYFSYKYLKKECYMMLNSIFFVAVNSVEV